MDAKWIGHIRRIGMPYVGVTHKGTHTHKFLDSNMPHGWNQRIGMLYVEVTHKGTHPQVPGQQYA